MLEGLHISKVRMVSVVLTLQVGQVLQIWKLRNSNNTSNCYTGRGYMKEQVFNAYETGLFYRDVVKRTYIMRIASSDTDLKSFQEYETLILCTNAKVDFKCKPLLV